MCWRGLGEPRMEAHFIHYLGEDSSNDRNVIVDMKNKHGNTKSLLLFPGLHTRSS